MRKLTQSDLIFQFACFQPLFLFFCAISNHLLILSSPHTPPPAPCKHHCQLCTVASANMPYPPLYPIYSHLILFNYHNQHYVSFRSPRSDAKPRSKPNKIHCSYCIQSSIFHICIYCGKLHNAHLFISLPSRHV
jgi:hypothetical protein